MGQSHSYKKALFKIGMMLLIPLSLPGVWFALETRTISPAIPPAAVRTMDEFLDWKKGSVKGRGTFESGGVTYTVILGPPARYLASGPSAYLFDPTGNLVDWTADMGDLYTVTHGFDLTSGQVKNIKRDEPSSSKWRNGGSKPYQQFEPNRHACDLVI